MRVCPKCNESYNDESLNFCLADGELLLEVESQDAPPTIMMDSARVTHDGNWGADHDRGTSQQDPGFAQNQVFPQNQQIYQQPFGSQQMIMPQASKDQLLPMVSVVSGVAGFVLSLCCYAGLLLGPVALITGFIGMKNVNSNPDKFDGKTLAIVGMIAGGIGLVASLLMLIFAVLINLIN